MGNTIGSSVGGAVAGKMKEAQNELVKIQQENMIKGQERQRKVMMSMQIAGTREMLNWTVPVWSLAALVAGVTAARGKPVPRPFLALIPTGLVLLFQADLAYGNKAERIQKYYRETLHRKFGITPPEESL